MSESATETLCRMLDERGVEWKDGDAAYEIEWSTPDGRYCSAMYWKPTFTVLVSGCTPEQAIAATLGSDDNAFTREEVESAFVRGYSLGSLPVGSDPQWDENRQTVDEHMAELGWVRAATLGGGECEVECFDDGVDESMDGEWVSYAPPMWYLSCGHEVQGIERPDYCVVCGKAVRR